MCNQESFCSFGENGFTYVVVFPSLIGQCNASTIWLLFGCCYRSLVECTAFLPWPRGVVCFCYACFEKVINRSSKRSSAAQRKQTRPLIYSPSGQSTYDYAALDHSPGKSAYVMPPHKERMKTSNLTDAYGFLRHLCLNKTSWSVSVKYSIET